MLDEVKLSTIFLLHLFAYSISEDNHTSVCISYISEQALRPKVKEASTACTFYTHKNITLN